MVRDLSQGPDQAQKSKTPTLAGVFLVDAPDIEPGVVAIERDAFSRSARRQNVTHLPVQAFGVEVPEMELVTVTLVPLGVKFTLPGPSVTFV